MAAPDANILPGPTPLVSLTPQSPQDGIALARHDTLPNRVNQAQRTYTTNFLAVNTPPTELAESPLRVVSTVPTQFDKLNLKQVCFLHPNFAMKLLLLLTQSYFPSLKTLLTIVSFHINSEYHSENKEVSSRAMPLGEIPDEVKTKLQDILQLLNQDIGLLVQDAKGAKSIFYYLKGQLPADVESALLPAAFVEGHQSKILQAQQRLSEWSSQLELITQREIIRSETINTKARADVLESS